MQAHDFESAHAKADRVGRASRKGVRIRDVLFAILCFIGLITVFQAAPHVAYLILNAMSSWWGRLLLTFAALIIASVLFYIREYDRFLYALMELAFGLVSTWYAVSTLTSDPTGWPVVIGAMYLIVRGLDNFKHGHNQRMIAWRHKGMNGTLEEREFFLKQLFHAARFNGRVAILAAPRLNKSQQEVLDALADNVIPFTTGQAKETGFDDRQTALYVEAHIKAYESLAIQLGLNTPTWKNT